MDVLMPQLGETVAEGKIVKWFKRVGDEVKPGDHLFEIETDKTSMEVPAIAAGTLRDIRFGVGEVAKVGAVVAIISGADESPPPRTTTATASTPAATSVRAPTVIAQRGTAVSLPDGRFAYPDMDPFREVRTPEKNYGPARVGGTSVTPLARRLASERGIDLTRVDGSGPGGRIVVADIENAGPGMVTTAAGASYAQVKALYEGVAYEEVPLDGMRTTIARRLVEAKQTIPHFYLTADVDIDRLLGMRDDVNKSAPRDKNGDAMFKLSLNDFIIKTWAVALRRVPAANAVWAADRILRFSSADIGVAVALDGGLITPVVRDADRKSIGAISMEIRDLAERARDRKLKPNEYRGGASAISNLGMYGVREFSAIINPPHATILAVGAARRAPVEAADGGIRFTSQMTVTLSCDHRVVDGALGAELLAAFRMLIENPVLMMV